ncbi:unnamed protein product [Peronospora destructor]|uniref:DUF4211 domain-containing protein n=1 Tax=Peronospora destructor TaxID=86335 RepID=A0AAV0T713_9STRA|nr:unnamed protein product [Peronospora destructor]
MPKYEEVIIDGDSTDEEQEVRIITPESRKRHRRSNIMTEEDEEEEGEEEKEQTKNQEKKKETKTLASSSSVPRRQQLLHMGRDGISSQYMTLRTPMPVRRSRRNLQQLSISAAVARGDRGRHHQHDEDNGNEDNDVYIVRSPSASPKTRNRRKSRCTAIQDSDEVLVPAEKEQDGQNNLEREKGDEAVMSSASRRSLRIQHHRQEKEAQHGIARKLAYPVLDNCLDKIPSLGPHYQSGSDDDDDDAVELAPEEAVAPPPEKRRRSLPREGERDDREKVYADGGEDVDDFICDDDEIEYMDDDEEDVISIETPDDEMEDDTEELTAILAAGRSREISEWFSIYLTYLEECIIDPGLENKTRRKRPKAKHQLYDQAVNRIERKLCSCRDSVRSGVAWPERMVDALKCASLFRSSHVSAEQDCEACNRRQHVATCHVELAGVACDATKLYGHNWMRYLKETTQKAAPVQMTFKMGSRTLAYWQLLHAKQFWCILVDAKIKECADSTGRIAKQYRNEFFTKEFGRYKRLVGLVEKFAEDSKRITVCMRNVWKRITRHNMTSDFLPIPSRAWSESRRGKLDAFVAESEEEDTEENEEAVMKKREEKQRLDTCGSNDDNQATDEEKEVKGGSRLGTLHSKRKQEQKLQLATKGDDEKGDNLFKHEKDIDDLMCLVCDASQRDAGVVHGLYLHVYCCYACAKRQHQMKLGCLVCNRPIDRVLRLLPLTLDARNAVRNHKS